MTPNKQSWSTVEEKLLTDIAKWKSKVPWIPRQVEEIALVEGALVMPTGKGVATMRIGKLEWELTPPSNYTGYCETKDDWLLVSGSEFKVVVHPPCRTRPLQICPWSEEVEFLATQALLPFCMQNLGLREESLGMDVPISNLDVDDKLSNSLLALFFDTKEAATSSLQKKAGIIGENFGTPFLKCVRDLRTAKSISDVLETILGLSAAYDLTQQALQQDEQETYDLTSYFYNEQVWEKDSSRKNGSLWVRQQVNHAAMKCQTAAAATSEVAEIGARILVDLYIKPSEVAYAFQFKREDKLNGRVVENLCDSEMDECSDEVNPNCSASLPFDQDGLMNESLSIFEDLKPSATPQHWNSEYCGFAPANLDGPSLDPLACGQSGIDDLGDSNNPTGTLLRTNSFGSSWQSDVGDDTCSESSWEVVRSVKNESNVQDEADVLGAEFSDGDNLDVMLRGLDPFGKCDCSPLINEFLSLNMNSATCSADDSDQELSSYVQEERETKVLQRLASWSSSNSGSWTDLDVLSSASSVKKMRTTPLETLLEEPACDPQISLLYRSFVFRAASEGNVLQWCSCKFNKLRCSIELKFQVGSFMEDDIATLSTGISRESPLYVEIFLDSTNVRESLLKGDVRVSAHQGVPFGYRGSWKNAGDKTTVLPPVAGLSCYIPHLVRQYLNQEVHVKRSVRGYEFPDGELLTGLMQYVVAQLVFIKHTCCVCNHETLSDFLTSIVPVPCGKNLCQALYGAWLVVAPPAVLELSTIVDWLKACFDEDPLYEAFVKHYNTHKDATWKGTYEEKVQRVAKWLADTKLAGSWLKIAAPKPKVDEKFESEAFDKPQKGIARPGLSVRTTRDSKTQATKRRRTLKLDDDESWNLWEWTASSPPLSSMGNDLEHLHGLGFGPGERIGNFVSNDISPMTTSPQSPKESNVLRARPLSLSKHKGEVASTSACPLNRTSPQAQGELSSHMWHQVDLFEISVASGEPSKRNPAQTQGESNSQGDRDFSWKKLLEDLEPLSLKEKSVARPPKRSPAQDQGESNSQGGQDWSWKKILDDLEPLSLKEKTTASTGLPTKNSAQAQAGKMSFLDFWKVEKRTPQQALGKSRFQEKTRISPQAQGESGSQDPAPSSWEDLIDED